MRSWQQLLALREAAGGINLSFYRAATNKKGEGRLMSLMPPNKQKNGENSK
jgi:hypothetical protein